MRSSVCVVVTVCLHILVVGSEDKEHSNEADGSPKDGDKWSAGKICERVRQKAHTQFGNMYDTLAKKGGEQDPKKGDGSLKDGDKGSVGNYLETARQMAYIQFGKIYDTNEKYGGKLIPMLQKANKHWSNSKKLEAIAKAVISTIAEEIPEYETVVPTEMRENGAFFCLNKGKMKDLRSIELVRTSTITEEDSVQIHLVYKFNNMLLVYDFFYLRVFKTYKMKGRLEMILGKNEVEFIVVVPKVIKLIKNITNKNCVITVKNFQVNELEYVDVRLYTEKKLFTSQVRKKINEFMKKNPNFIRHHFRMRVLLGVYNALSGDWVCMPDELKDSIKNVDPVFSKTFEKHCIPKEEEEEEEEADEKAEEADGKKEENP